jgi:ribosomal protein S18 acetylase RimI-like enzyme
MTTWTRKDPEVRSDRWREALTAGGAGGLAVFPEGRVILLVAEDATDTIVGIAAVGPDRADPTRGELQMINVAPDAWGRGVATPLLRSAERELLETGFREAILWVLESNLRARRFYEREGWSADGTMKEEERPGFTLRQVRYHRRLG